MSSLLWTRVGVFAEIFTNVEVRYPLQIKKKASLCDAVSDFTSSSVAWVTPWFGEYGFINTCGFLCKIFPLLMANLEMFSSDCTVSPPFTHMFSCLVANAVLYIIYQKVWNIVLSLSSFVVMFMQTGSREQQWRRTAVCKTQLLKDLCILQCWGAAWLHIC